MSEDVLAAMLRRDRAVVVTALIVVTMTAWVYLLWLAHTMSGVGDMGAMMAPMSRPWIATDFFFAFVMWAVMMVGMMTPSVAPMILLYAVVGREAARQGKPLAATSWFASGYFLAWASFALVAAVAQEVLQRMALLTPMLSSTSAAFAGAILITVGILQWTPLKGSCLNYCQSPLFFLQRHGGFRSDARGALRLGLQHGAYCIGCCWALMALLFVGGVMNVLWIAGLAIVVLVEKIVAGELISRLAGLALVGAGIWMLANKILTS
jgi:predicted metal-binding membrane protein